MFELIHFDMSNADAGNGVVLYYEFDCSNLAVALPLRLCPEMVSVASPKPVSLQKCRPGTRRRDPRHEMLWEGHGKSPSLCGDVLEAM